MGNKSPYHHKNKQTKVEEKKTKLTQANARSLGVACSLELKALCGIALQLAVHQLDYPNVEHLSHSRCCCVRAAPSSYCSSLSE